MPWAMDPHGMGLLLRIHSRTVSEDPAGGCTIFFYVCARSRTERRSAAPILRMGMRPCVCPVTGWA